MSLSVCDIIMIVSYHYPLQKRRRNGRWIAICSMGFGWDEVHQWQASYQVVVTMFTIGRDILRAEESFLISAWMNNCTVTRNINTARIYWRLVTTSLVRYVSGFQKSVAMDSMPGMNILWGIDQVAKSALSLEQISAKLYIFKLKRIGTEIPKSYRKPNPALQS
jgi:hypothetical protein